jgi:acetolactate decarboxylase
LKVFKIVIPAISILLFANHQSIAQHLNNEVKIIGAMKNVMWKSQLSGSINLDTIATKTNLYGIGPIEYLSGELLIIDGKSYKSTVISDTEMKVEESFDSKAPFFAHANIASWSEKVLPNNIQTIADLEKYLDKLTRNINKPFFFKINGIVEEATIHIVNLPKGSKVSSPDEAHVGQKNYQLTNEQSDIIGFFSREHKTIFTHHDTFLHMHLITSNRQKMGHLDAALFKKGSIMLYLPTQDKQL